MVPCNATSPTSSVAQKQHSQAQRSAGHVFSQPELGRNCQSRRAVSPQFRSNALLFGNICCAPKQCCYDPAFQSGGQTVSISPRWLSSCLVDLSTHQIKERPSRSREDVSNGT